MKNPFEKGDVQSYSHTVTEKDLAEFGDSIVHEVYSTFALGRDAEWSGRLFVLQMKEEHEEGIGTALHIEHIAPAFLGQEVRFTSVFERIEKNEITTSFHAKVGEILIAKGLQKQKIVDKTKLAKAFQDLQK